MEAVVSGLAMTPVKGTRLRTVDSVHLGPHGARENRRFFLIDERDEMVNAAHLGELNTVVSEYSDTDRRLSLAFPAGGVLEDGVQLGDEILTRFYGQPMPARLVVGEWSDAISRHVGS